MDSTTLILFGILGVQFVRLFNALRAHYNNRKAPCKIYNGRN